MNKKQIEQKAHDLLSKIWVRRHELWPSGFSSEIELIDPRIACEEILGLNYIEVEEFSELFPFRGKNFKVAGQLNRQINQLAVSREFTPEVH